MKLTGLALGATLALAPLAAAHAADPYIIGIAGAETGTVTATQIPVVELLRLYFDRVNARGGINGHPVKLFIEDDGGEASRAAANVVKLTREDHVQLLIEGSVSGTYGPVVAEAQRSNIPLLFAGSVCPPETHPPQAKPLLYCSTSFDATYDVPTAIDGMHQVAKDKTKFAMVSMSTPISRIIVDNAKKHAAELGMSILDEELVVATATDFTPYATKVQQTNPDWVMAYAPWLMQTKTFEALRRLGFTGPYVASGLLPAEDDLARIKDPLYEVIDASAMMGDDLPVMKEIKEAVAAGKYQFPATYAIEGWVAGLTVEAILNKAGFPLTTDKLVAAMNTLSVDTKGLRGGPIEWTTNNHFRTEQYYRLYHWDPARNVVYHLNDWLKVDVTK